MFQNHGKDQWFYKNISTELFFNESWIKFIMCNIGKEVELLWKMWSLSELPLFSIFSILMAIIAMNSRIHFLKFVYVLYL